MNILHANQSRIIAQAKFAYFPLGKALKRSNKETVLKSFKIFKTDEWKQIEGIFPKSLLNYLTTFKLKEVIQLQDII